jgi:transposase-like protein
MRQVQTRATKRSRWQAVVGAYRKSGLSVTAFSQQRRINLHTLRYWLQRFSATPELRPSSLFDEARREPLSEIKISPSEAIVLVMGSGVRLEIPSSVSGG